MNNISHNTAAVLSAAKQTKGGCVNCKKSLSGETDFLQRLRVCRACLQIYSIVDAAITSAADRKLNKPTFDFEF